MKIVIFAIVATLSSAAAMAEDQPQRESITRAVNLLSDCCGFYSFLALISEKENKPTVAEQFIGSARGAKFSAAYMLSIEASAAGRARKLGEFAPYIDNRADLMKGRMIAFLELSDSASIQEQGNLCSTALELQKALVQQMRDEMIDR